MKNLQLKIAALIFGIAIWFYAISLQDFHYTMEVPLTFSKIPEVLAIASKPPRVISVQVSGNVVDLIRMRYRKDSPAMISIDAQHVEQGWSHFTINADNFSAPDFPDVSYVEGDHIRSVDVEFDTKIRRKIPVKLTAEFEEASGYTFVNEPIVEPAEIVFSGARTALIPLENVTTEAGLFKNISQDGIYKLAINLDSIPAYVSTEDSMVQVKIAVQPIDTRIFEKIPVHLIGMYDKQKYTLEPAFAKVEITGGKDILKNIDPDELDIFIEFNRFAIENTDMMNPSIRLGKNVKGIQTFPDKFKLVDKEKIIADSLAKIKEQEDIAKKDSVAKAAQTVPAVPETKTEIKEDVKQQAENAKNGSTKNPKKSLNKKNKKATEKPVTEEAQPAATEASAQNTSEAKE